MAHYGRADALCRGRRRHGGAGRRDRRRARPPRPSFFSSTPPSYTAGTSARDADLIEARFPVHRTGRGGQFTYHGPGQRVGYVMLDLKRRQPDLRAYVGSARDLDHRDARLLRRRGRNAGGSRRRLGAAARKAARHRRRRGRRQDRGDRHPGAPLGELPRRRAQRRAGPRISPASCPAASAPRILA